MAEVAAELKLPAVAVCDRNGIYGMARFTGRAEELGQSRPIVGCELTMEDDSVLPVLVRDRTGYHNLCSLLTKAHLRAAKGEAAVTWEELPEFAGGLIALTGDGEGPLRRSLLNGEHRRPACRLGRPRPSHRATNKSRLSLASDAPGGTPATTGGTPVLPMLTDSHTRTPDTVIEQLIRTFGSENVFVELQRYRLRGENRIVRQLAALAEAHRLPLVATNGVCYAAPERRPVLDVFTCLRHHTHLDLAGALLSPNAERRLKSPAEMAELFADLPEAISNTIRIAEHCEFRLENLGYEFPTYATPDGSTQETFLRRAAFEGAQRRYPRKVPEKVARQMDFELALINKLGFAGYFLIVWDIVNFCRAEGILVQGRGSAANSAVCFCLGITAVDPVQHELLFERFLSEGRKSWPDIDLDLPSGDRRERVIQEVYRRYGRFGAAMTANVITYRGRSAAREIGKALNLSTELSDRFSSLFASGDFPHTLELREQMQKAGLPMDHPRTPAFLSLYQAMLGLPRHLGQHSGGMILCPGKLGSIVPLENASMPGRSVAQWDKDDCEDLGIIKIDLLGLGMMAAMQDTVELCAARGRPIDLATIPKDDDATYDLMCRADTIGVFQVESRAQMATLPRMKPRCFYDVCIEVAIIRPGPIQGGLMHPFLQRRAGKEPITYIDDRLEPVLKRTLGVPLFQEQILQIAMTMADFTGSEAEELRRAVSFHRSHERMEKVVVKLKTKMSAKGVAPEKMEQIIAAIQSFALYGFPESHAISFGLLAYASCWLKVHRAPEFFASLLNNQPMGFYSSATLVRDAKLRGIQVRPVCVVRSEWHCTISPEDDSIRLGLCVVRGLRREHGEALLIERGRRALGSIDDLKRRVPILQKDELRVLAEIGALNSLTAHRRSALWEAERELLPEDDLFAERNGPGNTGIPACRGRRPAGYAERHSQIELARDAMASAGTPKPTGGTPVLPGSNPLPVMSPADRLQADYRGTDLTTGPHPMALVRAQFPDLWRAIDLPQARSGAIVRVGGAVICRQRPGTAKGFVFISVEDETGVANAIAEPAFFEAHRLTITHEPFLVIEGRLQNVESVIHIRATHVEPLLTGALVTTASHDFH